MFLGFLVDWIEDLRGVEKNDEIQQNSGVSYLTQLFEWVDWVSECYMKMLIWVSDWVKIERIEKMT